MFQPWIGRHPGWPFNVSQVDRQREGIGFSHLSEAPTGCQKNKNNPANGVQGLREGQDTEQGHPRHKTQPRARPKQAEVASVVQNRLCRGDENRVIVHTSAPETPKNVMSEGMASRLPPTRDI